MKYTIYMFIYDEYKRFSENFESVNDFIYKNRINTIIQYYNENILTKLKEYNDKINYEYYKKFELNAIEIIESKNNDHYIPYFRLLAYTNIENNSFGIHRYGWKEVISYFLKQNYYENNDFYNENPDFEWVSYSKEYDLSDYESAIKHYSENIKYKSQMKYNKIKFIIFDEWFEKKYTWYKQDDKIYYNDFITFNHDPILYNLPPYLYEEFKDKDFKNIFEKNEKFKKDKENLKILITLSETQKNYLKHHFSFPEKTIIKTLYHPLQLNNQKYMFDIKKYIENNDKRLFFIGWWLRKYDVFLKLSCNKIILIKSKEGNHIQKYILNELRKNINKNINSFEYSSNKNELIEYINLNKIENDITNEELNIFNFKYNIEICDFLENEQYDKIFCNNIFFLDLYNCVANNILLECIMNNTPILVAMNESIVEYLGIDYPFYFTNYNDAENKCKDLNLITKTHYYLKNMDKTRFTYQHFSNELHNIIVKNI